MLETALFIGPFYWHHVDNLSPDFLAGSHFDWKAVAPFNSAPLKAIPTILSLCFALLPFQAGGVAFAAFFILLFAKELRNAAAVAFLCAILSIGFYVSALPNGVVWYFD